MIHFIIEGVLVIAVLILLWGHFCHEAALKSTNEDLDALINATRDGLKKHFDIIGKIANRTGVDVVRCSAKPATLVLVEKGRAEQEAPHV